MAERGQFPECGMPNDLGAGGAMRRGRGPSAGMPLACPLPFGSMRHGGGCRHGLGLSPRHSFLRCVGWGMGEEAMTWLAKV